MDTTKDSNMKASHAFNDHANGRRVLEQVWSNIGKVESANQGLQDVMKALEALLHFIKQKSDPGFVFEVELIPPLAGHLQTIARVAGQKGIVSLVFTDGTDGLLDKVRTAVNEVFGSVLGFTLDKAIGYDADGSSAESPTLHRTVEFLKSVAPLANEPLLVPAASQAAETLPLIQRVAALPKTDALDKYDFSKAADTSCPRLSSRRVWKTISPMTLSQAARR